MPHIAAFNLAGLTMDFYTNDHDPPHFHVIKAGHWKIKVHFTQCTERYLDYILLVDKRGSPDSKTLRMILRQVLAHQHELLEEWEATRATCVV